ncbi:restriction endonuclease subunit S [Corynebacterium amycolatum]|uniref:restriction endonuclease subunit S n=1 Tax=Corynebacterium amycolatum TaxID=43765 RepID=UPI00396B2CBD
MSETKNLAPLGVVAKFHTGWTPPTTNSKNFNGGLAWANIGDIASRKVVATAKTISEKALQEHPSARLAQPGDVLFPFKLSLGAAGIAEIPMYTNEAIATFPVADNPDFEARYLYYILPVFVPLNAAINIYGAPLLSSERIRSSRIPMPSLQKQRAIADYLDRETAEIDGMRADLDEMERLLEERRVSIIQRHVLPEDGTYTRVKLVADVSLGKTVQKTQNDASEELRNYVRAAHIQPHGRLVLDDQPMWFTPSELKQLTLETGDVLVVEGGAGYGRSVYLRDDLPGWGFQNHVIRVRPLAGASGRFIDYTIRAHHGAGLIDILADGATIPGLSSDKARELPLLNVSYDEQRRIADEIDRETAEIDSMLSDITKLRDLLAERRSAVISAAVTGQIDIPISSTHKDESHA